MAAAPQPSSARRTATHPCSPLRSGSPWVGVHAAPHSSLAGGDSPAFLQAINSGTGRRPTRGRWRRRARPASSTRPWTRHRISSPTRCSSSSPRAEAGAPQYGRRPCPPSSMVPSRCTTRRGATARPSCCWPPAACGRRGSRPGPTPRGTRSRRWPPLPVVAMDQRNTGTVLRPDQRPDGWSSYTADQLALMDHLGIERFGVLGMCIGGAFIAHLLATAPERVGRGGAPADRPGRQPGRLPTIFEDWRDAIATTTRRPRTPTGRPEVEPVRRRRHAVERARRSAGGPRHAAAGAAGRRRVPPEGGVAPSWRRRRTSTLVERWKDPADQPAARAAVDQFLAAHAD